MADLFPRLCFIFEFSFESSLPLQLGVDDVHQVLLVRPLSGCPVMPVRRLSGSPVPPFLPRAWQPSSHAPLPSPPLLRLAHVKVGRVPELHGPRRVRHTSGWPVISKGRMSGTSVVVEGGGSLAASGRGGGGALSHRPGDREGSGGGRGEGVSIVEVMLCLITHDS